MKLAYILLAFPVFISCKTVEKSADSALYGTALTGAASYLTYSESKEFLQDSAISLHLPSDLYAEEVTADELSALMKQVTFDRTFPTVMAYMGARDGYSYYMFKPIFGSRRIVKIKGDSNLGKDLDTLSLDHKKWRYVRPILVAPFFGKEPLVITPEFWIDQDLSPLPNSEGQRPSVIKGK